MITIEVAGAGLFIKAAIGELVKKEQIRLIKIIIVIIPDKPARKILSYLKRV
jgi:hypothetical protein